MRASCYRIGEDEKENQRVRRGTRCWREVAEPAWSIAGADLVEESIDERIGLEECEVFRRLANADVFHG
jgi:hypothetical protein